MVSIIMLNDEANWPVCTDNVNGINCLNQPPMSFQADREHDISHFRWIQPRPLSADLGLKKDFYAFV